ncbi:glycosyltransferase [Desertivirga arenae]|uniref:glycosyltransferase n=1 Tax=Desertivirga arenae TaxID=2810309 RepID=UPI001A96FF98|nr:glycosyltransferase [Pedobacter sp. SYSU D00823]
MRISVIIPTYNPNIHRLSKTLDALQLQSLPKSEWELIIVDNNSSNSFWEEIDLSWHLNAHLVREPKPGLTYARLKGFEESKSEIIVMVDDDNILDANYLQEALKNLENNAGLGAVGGKSIPMFEVESPFWLENFFGNLALRDLGNDIIFEEWNNKYPDSAPIGAGMIIRKDALKSYVDKVKSGVSRITDRKGSSLSSGGDNDIVIEILKSGWKTAYVPSISLQHIIPKERMEVQYLARLVHDTNISWVKLLNSHNINPWKKIPRWTLPLRIAKAWITDKAWVNEVNYIKWKGTCGTFKGLSEL